MIIARREKTLHRLFLISTWIKGAAGVLETLAGIPFFFIAPKALETFVVLLTAPELAEDPNDWIAIHLLGRCINFLPTQHFSRAQLWFLTAFIVYQCYRYAYTHSIWLVLLTIVDLIVAFLIWHEYQTRKRVPAGEPERAP